MSENQYILLKIATNENTQDFFIFAVFKRYKNKSVVCNSLNSLQSILQHVNATYIKQKVFAEDESSIGNHDSATCFRHIL